MILKKRVGDTEAKRCYEQTRTNPTIGSRITATVKKTSGALPAKKGLIARVRTVAVKTSSAETK